MLLKFLLRPVIPLLSRIGQLLNVYCQDGLITVHNSEFINDPRFASAYRRGEEAGSRERYWHWRAHVGLWAAEHCAFLEGDFVECGVNHGYMSSAIMSYLNWDTRGKIFYLLDTFSGIDEAQLTSEEIAAGALKRNRQWLATGEYVSDITRAHRNYSEWKNVRIVQGTIPYTLSEIEAKQLAFAHIDLNSAQPEVKAIEFLWPRIVDGGIVLLDDYAYYGYGSQREAMDAWAKRAGERILSLPTGQGLLLKNAQREVNASSG